MSCTNFPRMLVWQTAWEDIGNVYNEDNGSFWGKSWAGLLAAPFKDCSFLSLEFLTWHTDPLWAQHPQWLFCTTPRDFPGNRNQCAYAALAACYVSYAVSNKVLCFWPRSLLSSARNYKLGRLLLTFKQGKTSDPLQFLPVLCITPSPG